MKPNAMTVFRLGEPLPTAVMQELTREMRQFESIFVLQKARSQIARAWVFSMEEELDFAGHPVLGAAAALHEETMAGIRKVSPGRFNSIGRAFLSRRSAKTLTIAQRWTRAYVKLALCFLLIVAYRNGGMRAHPVSHYSTGRFFHGT
jgi:hypothetical protein